MNPHDSCLSSGRYSAAVVPADEPRIYFFDSYNAPRPKKYGKSKRRNITKKRPKNVEATLIGVVVVFYGFFGQK